MPPFVGTSTVEMQFIKVYVVAMRRYYSALQAVIDMMNPDTLGVKDFYEATKIALEAENLHENFERQLSVWRKKHKVKMAAIAPYPNDDDLADLFSLSFFKLLRAPDAEEKQPVNASGWFSGNPDEWKMSVKAYKNAKDTDVVDELNNILSKCFNAFSKLFGQNTFFLPPQPHGKKMWPPPANQDDYDITDWFTPDDEL